MKVLKAIDDNLEKMICVILLSVMTVVIFLQVLIRLTAKYTNISLAWTEELGRYLFIWLIYISSAMAVKLRAHIKVDVLKVVFGKMGNFILDILSNVFFFLFAAAFTYYSWNAVYRLAFVRTQYSATLHLPMWVPYFSITLGCALMVFRLIQDTVKLIREFRAPSSDTKEVDEA